MEMKFINQPCLFNVLFEFLLIPNVSRMSMPCWKKIHQKYYMEKQYNNKRRTISDSTYCMPKQVAREGYIAKVKVRRTRE